MKLFIVGTTELVCIREYSVKRDDNIAIECISFCIVEGDDIGIVIVAEIFVVDFQNFLVIDEHIAYLTDFFVIRCCHVVNPIGGFTFLDVWELNALCAISNHGVLFFLFGYIITHIDAKVRQFSKCT